MGSLTRLMLGLPNLLQGLHRLLLGLPDLLLGLSSLLLGPPDLLLEVLYNLWLPTSATALLNTPTVPLSLLSLMSLLPPSEHICSLPPCPSPTSWRTTSSSTPTASSSPLRVRLTWPPGGHISPLLPMLLRKTR